MPDNPNVIEWQITSIVFSTKKAVAVWPANW